MAAFVGILEEVLAGHAVDEADDENDDRAARAKIIAFYREHNPSKVQDVDALIAKYRDVGVGASELLIAVQKKYARDAPAAREPVLRLMLPAGGPVMCKMHIYDENPLARPSGI